ncbi:uncharacterized protein LOC130649149 [Hydractinia symbiolongicarpus]|uniref:uncharacterized protein LOC130649149 n=1 Tax=Hydractinia symbiolongicarpus TaxID=13093 RepID=UPI00254D0234|nr:uncharacterized protein LOC130649149 [Hydractinia symbiolongicarpus]
MAGIQILTFLMVLSATNIDSTDVFVSKSDGEDQKNCGEQLFTPCKSLEYVLQNKTGMSELKIKIDGGTDMLKPHIYLVNKSTILDKNITLCKSGDIRPSVARTDESSPWFLYENCEKRRTLNVDGIQFYQISLIRIKCNVTITISDCLIDSSLHFITTGFTQSAHYLADVEILNCKISNSQLLFQVIAHLKLNINNTSIQGGKKKFLLMKYAGNFNFRMSNCVLSGGIAFFLDYFAQDVRNITKIIDISNTQFLGKNKHKTAILVETFAIVTIRYCYFNGYTKTAVSLSISHLFITGSNFSDNNDGALYVSDGKGLISRSVFLNNTAKFGGAIYLSGTSLEIRNSQFISNVAKISGGAIHSDYPNRFTELKLRNVILLGKTKFPKVSGVLMYSSTHLDLINVSMVLQSTLPSWPGNGFHCNPDCVAYMYNKSYDFAYTCPENHDIEPIFTTYREEKIIATILCIRCKMSTYIEPRGSIKFSHNKSGTMRTDINSKCQKCPLGANCNDKLISRGNFWGYRSIKEQGIKFLPCPPLYCCSTYGSKCISYNSCNKNRNGYLCGSCIPGYRVNYFDGECVSNKSCWKSLFWVLYIFYVILYTGLLLFYKDLFLFVLKQIHRLKGKRKNRDTLTEPLFENNENRVSQYEEVYDDSGSNYAISLRSNTSTDFDNISQTSDDVLSETEYLDPSIVRNITGLKTILFFFYQIEALLQIRQRDKENHAFLNSVSNAISSVLNLQVISMKISKLCPYENFTNVGKEFVQSITVPMAIIFLFLVLGARTLHQAWKKIIKGCKQWTHQAKTFPIKIKLCLIQLTLLGYTGISAFCLKMVNCVNVNDTYYLYIQGDVVCYSWWQCLIIVFLSIWVVPFPLSTYLSLKLLDSGFVSISRFYICFVLPPYAIYLYILKKKLKMVNVTVISADNKEKDAIIELFTKPYRKNTSTDGSINWEVVVLMRRLTLSIICMCIHNPVFKMILTFPTLLLYQLHHWYSRPFFKNVLNRLETVSLSTLIVFNVFDLIWAQDYLYDLSNLPGFELMNTVFIWIRDIVLILPPLAILVIILIAAVRKLFWGIKKYVRDRDSDDDT